MKPAISLTRTECAWMWLEDGVLGWVITRVVEHHDGTDSPPVVISGAVDDPMDLVALLGAV